METVVGLIMAGGAGDRLGSVRKGDLRLRNRPLKQWLASILAPQCDTLLFSIGPRPSLQPDSAFELCDDPAGVSGPAAGLLAGARWCAANAPGALMVSVSVDSPFFPLDFVHRARPLLNNANCVVSAYRTRDYPTNALWRSDALFDALGEFPPAPRGPRLRDIQKAAGSVFLDYGDLAPGNPFAGINTLADLLRLSARLETP